MKIETIIFDFGGVILDIDPQITINEFVNLGFKDFEKIATAEFKNDILGKFERGIMTPEVFRNKLREFLNIDVSDQEIDSAWNALLYDIPRKRIEVIEEVKKHYNIYLLSNSNELHYDLFVRDLQLRFGYREFDELFHKSYFSFDLHLLKPNPEIYEFVVNQHSLTPENTLFIDDRLENIEAARNLGIKTFHLEKPMKIRDMFNNGILVDNLDIV